MSNRPWLIQRSMSSAHIRISGRAGRMSYINQKLLIWRSSSLLRCISMWFEILFIATSVPWIWRRPWLLFRHSSTSGIWWVLKTDYRRWNLSSTRRTGCQSDSKVSRISCLACTTVQRSLWNTLLISTAAILFNISPIKSERNANVRTVCSVEVTLSKEFSRKIESVPFKSDSPRSTRNNPEYSNLVSEHVYDNVYV